MKLLCLLLQLLEASFGICIDWVFGNLALEDVLLEVEFYSQENKERKHARSIVIHEGTYKIEPLLEGLWRLCDWVSKP